MAQSEVSIPSEAFIVPQDTLANTLTAPSGEPALADLAHPHIDPQAEPLVTQEKEGRRTLRRIVAGAALAGFLILGAEHNAEATPAELVADQSSSQSTGVQFSINPADALAGLGLIATAVSIRNSTTQKREERFAEVLQNIKGDSTGEERGARLRELAPFTKSRKYAPAVFETVATYLRGRRSGLEILRKEHKDDAEALDHALTERRNADRSALKQLLATLPAARRQVHKRRVATSIKRLLGRKDKLTVLSEITGMPPEDEKLRVNARGINLDDMRGIEAADFSDVDLTGSGLQRNQFTRVSFRNTRLCEALFEGTIVSSSDLREADLRAAYLEGATFRNCVIDKDTEFGNLPDDHPKSKYGNLHPEDKKPSDYRGDTRVILQDLISVRLSKEEIVQKVRGWQKNGLTLLPGSNPEYFPPSHGDRGHATKK